MCRDRQSNRPLAPRQARTHARTHAITHAITHARTHQNHGVHIGRVDVEDGDLCMSKRPTAPPPPRVFFGGGGGGG